MNKKFIVMAALVVALAAAGLFLAQAGPLDDLGKGLNDLNKAKNTVDKVVEPAKSLYDAGKPWPYPEERAAGRALAARVAGAFGGVWQDKAWTEYVNQVGRGLVPYSNRPDIKYRFAILNTADINAYSCPGGYIFITKGLLKEIKNEDQLAGVLAHEIGHVSERQIEKAMRQEKQLGALLQGGLTIAQDTGNLSGDQAQLAKQMSDLSWEILIKKGLSQQDEFEADRVAVDNMAKMGYNPMGLHQVLARLKELSGGSGSKMQVMLSTHPAPEKRMEQVMQTITGKGYNQSKPTLDARYTEFKSKHPL
jgi:beta-barrel assembly-enhancing protease